MEAHHRSLAKAFSWRIIAVVITACVAYFFTESAEFAVKVGLVDSVIKFGAYYFHERAWGKVRFGRTDKSGAAPVAAERSGTGAAA